MRHVTHFPSVSMGPQQSRMDASAYSVLPMLPRAWCVRACVRVCVCVCVEGGRVVEGESKVKMRVGVRVV